ncbi:MAG: lytic transglycosylase [Pelagibacteraceae bacterium TMED216]|nr:MAG: lytic transglycosylase [Pelagibacteraceae bacterium TMED216]
MLIRLISLAILLLLINVNHIGLANDKFILPKDKPSVFKKIDKTKTEIKSPIPQIKPIIKTKENAKVKEKKIEEKKVIEKKDEKLKLKAEKDIKKSKFILPQKKPKTIRKITASVKKSKFLNQKDFERAKTAFSQIKSGKIITGYKTSKKIKDKDFKLFVQWLYLMKSSNNATFLTYETFIRNNMDFPRIGRLQYLAEQKIYLKNSSPKYIIKWFEKFPPVSGTGKLKLGEAFFELKDINNAKQLIKEGWVNADLSKSSLRFYRKKFKSILDSEDHIKRADYLAWNKKYWDLKRMLVYLPSDFKALYNARQILMSNSYGVDNAIAKVPDRFKNDIGLEYDRLKWRNRRGRLESSLQILYDNSNRSEEELVRADLWWKQRESIVRSLIYKKRYKTAYKVASEHSLSSGPEFAEAEWLAGWIAHSFLKSQEYAINHFLNFYDNVSYPISLGRGAYWLGKSYQETGNIKKAEEYFKQGSKFLTTYYGQLCFKEINYGSEFTLSEDATYSKDYEKEFLKNKLVRIIKIMKELNHTKYTKDVLKHLANLNIDEGSEVLAAKLATEIERYDFAIQISKKASYEKRFYLKYNYPIISTPREINNKSMPPSEMIHAIIRQESEFDSKANSYAGARGMMQLMKYTAKIVAKQAKLPYSISGLTNDPIYNIKLGSYYFNGLLSDYNGVYPFAIAAYNAGPNRVKTWRRVNGDPSKNQLSYIDWIELIRFKETRNYVQRVLENVNVYKYMISQEPVKIEGFFK